MVRAVYCPPPLSVQLACCRLHRSPCRAFAGLALVVYRNPVQRILTSSLTHLTRSSRTLAVTLFLKSLNSSASTAGLDGGGLCICSFTSLTTFPQLEAGPRAVCASSWSRSMLAGGLVSAQTSAACSAHSAADLASACGGAVTFASM